VIARVLVLSTLVVVGCATTVPVQSVAELAGEWHGRVSNPAGNAAAALTVAADGAFKGTMFLIGGDRPFQGALVVVRPGQIRYQGTDGNGTVRVLEEGEHRTLKFFRDDGGIDAVFRRP
jgi:hypothetical protein